MKRTIAGLFSFLLIASTAVAQDSSQVAITSIVVAGGDTLYSASHLVMLAGSVDTVYLPADTVFIPPDTVMLPPDTVVLPPDTIQIPCDTVVPPDTTTPPDTPPSQGNTVFTSDFNILGSSNAALLNGGWDQLLNNGDALTVVSSAGLEFPTPNVLRIHTTARGSRGAYSANIRLLPTSNVIPVPSVGESIFYRWYIRMMVPNSYTADNLTHPIQDGRSGGSDNWQFEVVTQTNGRWTPRFFTGTGGTSWPNYRWVVPSLEKNRTYRFELQVHRNGSGTFQIHVRVYDSAGLLYTDADIQNVNGSARLSSNPSFRIYDLNVFKGWQIGLNGFSAGSGFGWVYSYQGAVAVCVDDWCGAR